LALAGVSRLDQHHGSETAENYGTLSPTSARALNPQQHGTPSCALLVSSLCHPVGVHPTYAHWWPSL
jgi:hypothetical protein